MIGPSNSNREIQPEVASSLGVHGRVPRSESLAARGRRQQTQNVITGLALAFTVFGVFVVHPYSMVMYVYYMMLWGAFMYVLHRREAKDFLFAYVVNSAFIVAFYLIQTHVYPESYGTTSPLGAWTDDSYFFSLVADSVPPGIELRQNYHYYTEVFSSVVKFLTVLPINHPMDVVFFQSGVAALLATFTKRFMWQMSGDERLANTVFIFCIVCPFLLMNGGAIFVRDTFVAALFIYVLSCLVSRRFILAGAALILELALRPGTGLILLPAIVIIYLSSDRILSRRNLLVVAACVPLLLVTLSQVGLVTQYFPAYASYVENMNLTGRVLYDDLANSDGNAIFRYFQELPFLLKFLLNGAYIFVYPFLDPREAFSTLYFDARAVTMGLIVPVYAYFLNAWFIAGTLTKVRAMKRQKQVVLAVLVTILLIGTYSLQTRHKTIIYPLYYLVVAVGFAYARPTERRIGYIGSFALAAAQLAISLR